MRREGSALHGFGVVTIKEIADHFTSILVVVLVVLIVATAVAVVRGAIDQIKEITAEDPYLFLRLFTRGGPLPLVALLSFLVPLVAIGLGFDSVNGEHNRRTLARAVAADLPRRAAVREVHRRAVHPGGEPHRALASGDRARIAGARGAAQCRGDGAP